MADAPDGPAGAPEPWYAQGLRFACQRSGRCCVNHGDYGYVYLKAEDEERLAAHLELEPASFRRRYTEKAAGGLRVLRSRGDACIFLDGRDCGVYLARPTQCATWPFWRDTLDERTWRDEVAPFCPGVGKGRLHTRAEIEALAAEAAGPEHPPPPEPADD